MRNVVMFAVSVVGVVAAAACSDRAAPLPADSDLERAVGTAELVSLTRAFAGATNDEAIRAGLRDAMRSSPFSLHRIVVQDFVSTPVGRRWAEAAARVAGQDVNGFRQRLAALPELEIYLPFRQQRLSWRAENDLAFVVPAGGRASGFDHLGSRVTYASREPFPAHTVVALVIADHRGPAPRRLKPQAAGAGAVIQDPEDGELAVSGVVRQADGRMVEFNPATGIPKVRQYVTCEECGGGGGTGGGTGTTSTAKSWLDFWYTYFIDQDVADAYPWGSMEIEFKSRLYNNSTLSTLVQAETKVRFEGVTDHVEYAPRIVMAPWAPSGSQVHWIEIVETDTGSDEHLGVGYWDAYANGQYLWHPDNVRHVTKIMVCYGATNTCQ